MRSGLANCLTKLIFKEDYAVSEQQQNLLFFNSEWTIWMVCNLRGMESLLRWDYILKFVFPSQFGVFQREAKKGERGFCLKKHDGSLEDPENPDEVAWPNATEVFDDCIETQYFENSGVGFLPQVMRN